MQSTWQQLFTLAVDDTKGSELLRVVLERWCKETEVAGAALYLVDGDGLRRELSVGEGSFPPFCKEAELDGFATFSLPAGALVYGPSEGPEDNGVGPLSTLLVLLARISTLRRGIKEKRFEARHRGVEQAALYEVGLAITSTLDLDDVSEAILTWALSLLDARRAALYLFDGRRYTLARALGGEAKRELSAADAGQVAADEMLPEASHTLAAPIEAEGQPRGLLVVADKETRTGVGPFGEKDQGTLRLFANQAAIALENARLHRQALEIERLEREMELAAEIQRQILPKTVPEIEGYELIGWNRPARQVGGDYYALDETPNGRLIVAVGDVSGKGMPASLMVSTLHSALRLMLDRHDLGPDLVERLNHHVVDSSASNKFITLIVCELEPSTGELSFVNAGHNSGILVSADCEIRLLGSGGLPVGLLPASQYRAGAERLAPGDLLCLYSDGITECEAPDGEELGFERLVELLREHRERPIAEILEQIDRAVIDFAQGRSQGDDQTVVLLRRLP